MSSWTRRSIIRLYRDRCPDRGDARYVTDKKAGTWTLWICYDDRHRHYFSWNMESKQEAMDNALELLEEDARGNLDLEYETNDSEESDDDHLHDSDSDDPDDQGDYARPCLSDNVEDFGQRNNFGNPNTWDESDGSYGFVNGVGQVGSYGRR